MWKQKIGMSIGNRYSAETVEVVKLLKTIGFDAVSPEYTTDEALEKIVLTARECGMFVQSLHAPFSGAANMWSADENAYSAAKAELFASVAACKRFSIPVTVVHAWIGFDYAFDEGKLYFQNYDDLVRYAKECGVKIAFENTEGEEFLFALLKRYEGDDTVGFCWDSGHEACYNRSRDLLALFGDRLLVTHLNDNLGVSRSDGKTFWTDDLHLLPYDGIADWDNHIARLLHSRRLDCLNFELNISSKPNRHENDGYAKMSLTEYFTEAYKRACKIAYRYSK